MSVPEPSCLFLTTRGRRTGLPREIEIWFVVRSDKYYVIAEHAHSQWLRNLRSDPRVHIRVGDGDFDAQARILDPLAQANLAAAVQSRFREKYGWGDGVIVELDRLLN